MTKVAIFVEGQTEAELVIRVLRLLCGNRGIQIERHEQRGGTLHLLTQAGNSQAQFFALVANCNNDGQVNSQIRDRYAGLAQQGFTYIVGLRDLYPMARHKLPRFQLEMQKHLPVGNVPVDVHLAVMEVEAWFLDEVSHFERIDAALTLQRLDSEGFDVQNRLGESWDAPAETLDSIYQLVGKAWKKTAKQVERTVEALCMDSFYVAARDRSPSLDAFFTSLESALFPAAVPHGA